MVMIIRMNRGYQEIDTFSQLFIYVDIRLSVML